MIDLPMFWGKGCRNVWKFGLEKSLSFWSLMGYCGNKDCRGLACEVSEGNKHFLGALQESLIF